MAILNKVNGDYLDADTINTYSFHRYDNDAANLISASNGDCLTDTQLNLPALGTYANNSIFTATQFGYFDQTMDFIFVDTLGTLTNYDLASEMTADDYVKFGTSVVRTTHTMAHSHTAPSSSPASLVDGPATCHLFRTWVSSSTTPTVLYYQAVLRKKKFRTTYFSFPPGAVILSTQNLSSQILSGITAETSGKFPYISDTANTTGGSSTHLHYVNCQEVGSWSFNQAASYPWAERFVSQNNEPNNTTLFAYKCSGAYDSTKDQTPINACLLSDGTALPANYSFVTVGATTGCLRYKASGTPATGGTTTHGHTKTSSSAQTGADPDENGTAITFTNLPDGWNSSSAMQDTNHMPTYKTYRLIRRNS